MTDENTPTQAVEETETPQPTQYELDLAKYKEEITAYAKDIFAIRQQIKDAETANAKFELSNKQVKKIKAKAYNEEREYRMNNPQPRQPIDPKRKVSPGALTALAAMSMLGRGL